MRITVGMPVRNGMPAIKQAVACLLRQTRPPDEFIVSDNASDDGTWQWVHRQPVKALRNAEDIGANANFNRVLEAATGDAFMWAAHDDLWDRDYIVHMQAALDERASAVVAFCIPTLMHLGEDGLKYCAYERVREHDGGDAATRVDRFVQQDGQFGKAHMIYGLFRTSVLRDAGGMPDALDGDAQLLAAVLHLGEAIIVPRVLFHKRMLG